MAIFPIPDGFDCMECGQGPCTDNRCDPPLSDVAIGDPGFENIPPHPATRKADKQVGGDHYERMPIMPFTIIDAFDLDFYGGNALKYLLRAGRKPGTDKVEELKKARHYLDEMIERAKRG